MVRIPDFDFGSMRSNRIGASLFIMKAVTITNIFIGIDPTDNVKIMLYKLTFDDASWVYETAYYDEDGGLGWIPATQSLCNKLSEILCEKDPINWVSVYNDIIAKAGNKTCHVINY